MASVHHVFVLFFATTLRLELVASDLVIGPPLATLDMLTDGVHLDIPVSYVTNSIPGPSPGTGSDTGVLTSWADEVLALIGDRIPVPLEQLDDDLWGEVELNDWILQDAIPGTHLFRDFASEMVRLPRG